MASGTAESAVPVVLLYDEAEMHLVGELLTQMVLKAVF